MRYREFDARFKTLVMAQSPTPRAQTMLVDELGAESQRLREPINLHYQYIPRQSAEQRSFDF